MKKILFKSVKLMFWILAFSLNGWCQLPEATHTISISKPESVSIDRFNNIYITDSKGNIDQYNKNGKLLEKYSPPKPVKITLLESWQAIRIFAFSQDLQQILFLDRFLVPSPVVKLQDLSLGFIRTATVSIDNNLWLIDDSDLSLKKYDMQHQRLLIHSPLNLQLGTSSFDINFAREYQNQLFINDLANGIHLFDNLGNHLKTLPIKGLRYFNFLNDELYYLEKNQVIFYNFYNLQERSIEVPNGYHFALVTGKTLVLISNSKMEIFEL